jgi:pyridoxamine 5'-phosphate oxidase family protein
VSVFTQAEIEYLRSRTMGRLATIGPDGQPHVIPLTFHFNAEEDTIDLGGVDFATGKKWRDAQGNPRVTLLVDDADPDGARAIEIRGEAELHATGGERINPRFPNFVPEFMRIRPRRIVSWGLEQPGFHPFSRSVRWEPGPEAGAPAGRA